MTLLLCSLIYWREGAKDSKRMEFTNSDPMLVKTFLSLLRNASPVNKEKFKVVAHLHEYHDVPEQIKFWSKVTDMPFQQFDKPFLKGHTGKRVREGYNGCISVRYHDTSVAKLILSIAKAFILKYGCVG